MPAKIGDFGLPYMRQEYALDEVARVHGRLTVGAGEYVSAAKPVWHFAQNLHDAIVHGDIAYLT